MTTRACLHVVAILAAATTALADELPVAKGIKAAVVDCYKEKTLEGDSVPIVKAAWPGAIRAKQVHDRALLFTVGANQCWIERSDLVLDVPGPSECDQSRGSLATRGLGEGGHCPEKKK